jgi:hypothetical protein
MGLSLQQLIKFFSRGLLTSQGWLQYSRRGGESSGISVSGAVSRPQGCVPFIKLAGRIVAYISFRKHLQSQLIFCPSFTEMYWLIYASQSALSECFQQDFRVFVSFSSI